MNQTSKRSTGYKRRPSHPPPSPSQEAQKTQEAPPRPKASSLAPAFMGSARVAIVGRPNVGKSTLLNEILGQHIAITSSKPQTTRDPILGIVRWGDIQFIFVDTPGLHKARSKLGQRMNLYAKNATSEADVIVFLCEIDPKAQITMAKEDKILLNEIQKVNPRTKVILVINKIDRIKEKAKLLPVLEAYSKESTFDAIIPISALRRDGVEALLNELGSLVDLSPKIESMYHADDITDKPLRFFVAEYLREQILELTHEEVPHGVAVTVERFDEHAKVAQINLTVHVDRDSHKPILLGKGGLKMKRMGSQARIRIEEMMQKQVNLKIHVRVTPGWYENEAKLSEFGYVLAPRSS